MRFADGCACGGSGCACVHGGMRFWVAAKVTTQEERREKKKVTFSACFQSFANATSSACACREHGRAGMARNDKIKTELVRHTERRERFGFGAQCPRMSADAASACISSRSRCARVCMHASPGAFMARRPAWPRQHKSCSRPPVKAARLPGTRRAQQSLDLLFRLEPVRVVLAAARFEPRGGKANHEAGVCLRTRARSYPFNEPRVLLRACRCGCACECWLRWHSDQ